MSFKEKQPQEDGITPPATMESVSKAQVKDLKPSANDIVYPSGIKLVLLMMSIFVGMFLVSLVR